MARNEIAINNIIHLGGGKLKVDLCVSKNVADPISLLNEGYPCGRHFLQGSFAEQIGGEMYILDKDEGWVIYT